MPHPGMLLAGRYRLDELIGAGGMGEVWRATHTTLERTFAIKLMQPALVADPDAVRRFRAEAWAMGKVNHPRVAAVYDFHDDADGAYLVMEFVEGEALSDRLRRDGPLSPATTMELVAQAAEALQAAHDQGLVHRDVKPGNLLIRTNGDIVLTDFGIARLRDAAQITGTGTILGTPSYLAPEQALGQPATPQSDIYALGVVGYECLTGHRPFEHDNPFATAMARVDQPPPPLPDHLPPPARTVVDHALAREPHRRWPTADHLAAACRQAAADTPPRTPAAAPAPAPRHGLTRKAVAALTAAAATITVAAVTAAVVLVPQLVSALGNRTDVLAGHSGAVFAVATGEMDGTPIAVSGGDRTVRVWDLTTGKQIGDPLTGHTEQVVSVAVGEVGGTPIAVSGGRDETVRVWDLTTGQPVGDPITSPDRFLWSVAVGEIDGDPIAVSGAGGLWLWDLPTGRQLGDPIRTDGLGSLVWSVAAGEIGGAPVAVSAHSEHLLLWDLTARQRIGVPMTGGHSDQINAVAVGEVDGTPIAVSAGEDQTLRIWDLTNGQPIGDPLIGHTGRVRDVAIGEIDATPVAVSASHDQTLRIWDLTNGQPIGDPITSRSRNGGFNCVAFAVVDGVPTAVAGARDRRLWVLPLSD